MSKRVAEMTVEEHDRERERERARYVCAMADPVKRAAAAAASRAWMAAHPGSRRITPAKCAAKARYRQRHPERSKDGRLRREYGITLAQYQALCVEQDGQCAICGQRPDRLCVDHCHATRAFRGLLCVSCNHGLGNFRDNPVALVNAALYLQSQPENFLPKDFAA